MFKNTIILFFTFFTLTIYSQLTVDSTLTAEQLVQNILVGSGLQTSNITHTGSIRAIGAFNGQNSNIGFTEGILLTTGGIRNAIGPNNETNTTDMFDLTGDADITDIANVQSYDASILEFDLVPTSDTIKFNYVFASDEYMEYVGFDINDAFGFFLSGPGINGPFSNNAINLARVPGTNQNLTINNLNQNVNSIYYFDNEFPAGETIEYDGFTVPLEAKSAVQCGQTYHLKIVIADAFDDAVDSGVFLEAKSLFSPTVDFTFNSNSGATDFYESCTQAELIITRPQNQSAPEFSFDLIVSGTATEGLDYSNLPHTITFLPGQESITIPFQTFSDTLIEYVETLIVTASFTIGCSDLFEITKEANIHDPIRIDSISSTQTLLCSNTGVAEAFVSNFSGNVTYNWSKDYLNNPTISTTNVIENLSSGWYYLQVSDDICHSTDSVFVASGSGPTSNLELGSIFGSDNVEVNFINTSQNADHFDWYFGNGLSALNTDDSNQSSIYLANESYTITLVAFQGICTDTAFLTITPVEALIYYVPNTFTPDGNHFNNVFLPVFHSGFQPNTYHLVIYNRWGELIFESFDHQIGWDGSYKDVGIVENGIYNWKINFRETKSNLVHQKSGHITLLK